MPDRHPTPSRHVRLDSITGGTVDPYYSDESITLHHGDCLDVLRALPDASVDSVVTDPPYGLANTDPAHVAETITRWVNGDREYLPGGSGFMGAAWDAFVPPVAVWDECLRVLKPGGHLLAFAGSRTFDLMALGIRLAGFEVRDSIAWMYGSGFPKSLDVSKAIDKQRHDTDDKLRVTWWLADVAERNGVTRADVDAHMGTSDMGGWWLSRLRHRCAIPTLDQVPRLLDVLGVAPDDVPDEIRALLIDLNGMKGQPGPAWFRREVTGQRVVPDASKVRPHFAGVTYQDGYASKVADITAPATADAERWQGWGSAMKPAFEPVVVARKPFQGTLAANVLAHGTGALNIDATRVGADGGTTRSGQAAYPLNEDGTEDRSRSWARTGHAVEPINAGRWPANVILDESQAAALDEQSGELSHNPPATWRRDDAESNPSSWSLPPAGAGEIRSGYGDSGGASRFFYVAREDNESCPDPDPATSGTTPTSAPGVPLDGLTERFRYVAKAPTDERPRVNGIAHPTTKPLTLMRWLVRLVTPPGGTVLEPFAGSGTTVEACILEGFRCIAIEREADYLPLIKQRIDRRLNPVEAVRGSGGDGGLFDLLEDA